MMSRWIYVYNDVVSTIVVKYVYNWEHYLVIPSIFAAALINADWGDWDEKS